MRYRDIRRSVSEMGGGGGGRRKDDSMKNSVMNPDRYTPQQARELGLIGDKEYARRQIAAQGIEPVYPELFLSPAGALRGTAGTVARNTVGNAARSEIVPTAGNVVKNVAGRDVTTTGGNVTKSVRPELRTIDAPPQLPGPRVTQTKQIGRNDPNVIDVDARVVPNRPQLSVNKSRDAGDTFPDAAHDFYHPPVSKPIDLTLPGSAAAASAVVGGGLYGLSQGLQPRQGVAKPADTPPAEPQGKTLPDTGSGAGQGNRGKDQLPANPPKTDYKGSAAAQRLAASNNIADPNSIKIGQTLDLGGGNTHVVKAGDTLDKIAAKSSLSIPPKDAVVPAAPTAPATTFSQDVEKNKAAAAAPWTKPATPALNIPNPVDDLDRMTNLAGVAPKTSTVPPAPASEPPEARSLAPASNAASLKTAQDTAAGNKTDWVKDFTASTTDRIKKLAADPESLPKLKEPDTNENIHSRNISKFPFISGL